MNDLQELTLDSREVSKMLPKRHADLLRDIEVYNSYLVGERNFALSSFWVESRYTTSQNKVMKCYQITKKGCEFLAHKMTGKKGALFTASYINRFHEMEEELQNVPGLINEKAEISYSYKGKPVMVTTQLARITGAHYTDINYQTRKYNIPYTILVGQELRMFKKDNGIVSSSSKMTIYNREAVVDLLKRYTAYEGYRQYVEEYFTVDEDEINDNAVDTYIIKLEMHVETLAKALRLYKARYETTDCTSVYQLMRQSASDAFAHTMVLSKVDRNLQ